MKKIFFNIILLFILALFARDVFAMENNKISPLKNIQSAGIILFDKN